MLSFFTAKGGAGCSVVAAATALLSSRAQPTLLVDLNGDQPALLGLDSATSEAPGLAEWFQAPAPLPDALRRLELPVTDRLSVLPTGACRPRPGPEPCRLLARLLATEGRQVVLDVGSPAQPLVPLLAASRRTVLVTRACYLALRAARSGPDPDVVVLVSEPGRALRARDVEASTGAPVGPMIAWDPAVARAVDAGLLTARVPRALRSLRDLL